LETKSLQEWKRYGCKLEAELERANLGVLAIIPPDVTPAAEFKILEADWETAKEGLSETPKDQRDTNMDLGKKFVRRQGLEEDL
jgi:hypothetical protein